MGFPTDTVSDISRDAVWPPVRSCPWHRKVQTFRFFQELAWTLKEILWHSQPAGVVLPGLEQHSGNSGPEQMKLRRHSR